MAIRTSYEAQCQQLQTEIFKLQMEEKQKVVAKRQSYVVKLILLLDSIPFCFFEKHKTILT
jgi:hypothetical protein